jgi:micrococcal nuclease
MAMHTFAQIVRIGVYGTIAGLMVAGSWVATRAAVSAPEPVCRVKQGEMVKIAEILDGGALRLVDGRRILLSGVDVPRAKGAEAAAPFADRAKAAMSRILKDRMATLGDASLPSKNGWIRAQVYARGNEWVQGAMVKEGLARVRTFPDRRECAHELLTRESTARSAKRGVWASADYAVHQANAATKAQGAFALIEGRIESVANVRGRVFLNFGPDFRTDFTVHVKPDHVRLFSEAGFDLENLEGKRIRARGFVRDRNGPVIDAAAPEQIEMLN